MTTTVITGAGQGIGRALALRLAQAGDSLVLVDLQGDAVREVAASTGAIAVVGSVFDDAVVAEVARAAPGCTRLVNNAALTLYQSLLDTDAAAARAVLDVNVVGPLLLARALAPAMKAAGGGSIVNLSSVTARYHPPSTGLYSASKAALEGLTRALAVELGPDGIRCNAVAPGITPTEGSAAHYGSEEERRRRGAVLPLRRLGREQDITAVVAFLLSDESSYVTGEVIAVDGGYTVSGGALYRLARQAAPPA